MKFGGISAQEVEALIVNEFYKDRRELVMDLSSTFNEEYHELADAGCKIIQIEEPALHEVTGISHDRVMTLDFYVETFNREVIAIVRGTNIVRRELGAPEPPIRAADPRFQSAWRMRFFR